MYLSSTESRNFSGVHAIDVIESVQLPGGAGVLVDLDPPVIGQPLGTGRDQSRFILYPRLDGTSVNPVGQFPCLVYVLLPLRATAHDGAAVWREGDFQNVAWPEIYATAEDARLHRF